MANQIDLTQDLPWEYFSRTGLIRPEQTTEWNQFRTAARNFVTPAVDAVFKHLLNELSRYKAERNAARAEATEKQTCINRLIEERDDYMAEWRVATRRIKELEDASATGTPGASQEVRGSSTAPSTATSSKAQKSEKVADPPVFRGKEGDKLMNPKYEDWIIAMRRKLRANADQYNTKELRIAYVDERVDREAADHLRPYLDKTNPLCATTAEKLFSKLDEVYKDPNRVEKARDKLRKLWMNPKDNFHTFHTNFIRLAYNAKIAKSEYKFELNSRLYTRLRELVIQEYTRPSMTFAEFISICSTTAHQLKTITDKEAQRRPQNPSRNASLSNPKPAGPQADKKPETSQLPRNPDPRVCFKCNKPGHIAKWCRSNIPLNKNTAVKELEEDTASDSGKESA
jgi:hypothetical protein